MLSFQSSLYQSPRHLTFRNSLLCLYISIPNSGPFYNVCWTSFQYQRHKGHKNEANAKRQPPVKGWPLPDPLFYSILFSTDTVLFCYNHMYRALAHPESLICLTVALLSMIALWLQGSHNCSCNIVCDADGTLFDIILQRNVPAGNFLLLYEGFREGMTEISPILPPAHIA